MKLLIDVGNSRLKWALADDHGMSSESGAQAHDGNAAAALGGMALPDPPESIWISSVAGPAAKLDLTRVCAGRWQHTPTFFSSQSEQGGLINAYDEPGRLGVDRWLAMLAAWNSARGACLVADAGTALTVDAIGATGQHLGGIIAAGLKTSEKSLLGATRFATVQSDDRPSGDELGTNTENCVRQGALLSCLGAIERVAAQHPDASAFLTGGDAQRLAPLLSGRWQLRPQLVMEGMLIAARSA